MHQFARSRVTNGTALFVAQDGRTVWARRLRDVRAKLIEERGGEAALEAYRLDAIRAYATLIIEREAMEGRRAAGESIDVKIYGQLADRCDRLFRRMGPATVRPGSNGAPAQTWDERLAARRAAQCDG